MIIVGCEYAGKTTLIHRIVKWGKEAYGGRMGYGVHDHFDFAPRGMDPKDVDAAGRPPHESWFRFNFFYHVLCILNSEENVLLGGFHVQEAVYAPLYRGYYPVYIRQLEGQMHPDTILLLLTASPKEITKRMEEKPHQPSIVSKKDVPLVLKKFEEEYEKSWIASKMRVDTTNRTVEETLEEIYPLLVYHSKLRPS